MNISKVHAVYFSPCSTTAQTVRTIADKAAEVLGIPVQYYDFTLPKNRKDMTEFASDELVIFGMPVYAGRIPNLILPIVQKCFRGNDALAVPVYGGSCPRFLSDYALRPENRQGRARRTPRRRSPPR